LPLGRFPIIIGVEQGDPVMKQILSRLAGALALLCLFALSGSAGAQSVPAPKKITFLTNYVFHGRHSPFFVGLDKGFYKEAGFDIDIQPATGSGFVVAALDGGKADYGMADSTSVVQAIAKGAKIKAFGVFMDITTNGLASFHDYAKPEMVLGKPVAAALTDSIRTILPIVLSLNKLDPSKIVWQTADPSTYAVLLMTGQVDLVTATLDGDVPAWNRLAAAQGKGEIKFSSFADWGYDVFGYFLCTQGDRVAQHPDEVKAFAAATVKSVAYAVAHPEETAQIMVKYNPTLNEALTLAQWRQAIKGIETPYVKTNGYGIATTDRVERTIGFVKQAFKVEAPIMPDQVYAPGLVAK
jgi:NitT/TauT family transport system substrate-binding protein